MKREEGVGGRGIYNGETGMPRGCVFWPTGGVRVGVLMFGENRSAVVSRLPSLWKQLGRWQNERKRGWGG